LRTEFLKNLLAKILSSSRRTAAVFSGSHKIGSGKPFVQFIGSAAIVMSSPTALRSHWKTGINEQWICEVETSGHCTRRYRGIFLGLCSQFLRARRILWRSAEQVAIGLIGCFPKASQSRAVCDSLSHQRVDIARNSDVKNSSHPRRRGINRNRINSLKRVSQYDSPSVEPIRTSLRQKSQLPIRQRIIRLTPRSDVLWGKTELTSLVAT